MKFRIWRARPRLAAAAAQRKQKRWNIRMSIYKRVFVPPFPIFLVQGPRRCNRVFLKLQRGERLRLKKMHFLETRGYSERGLRKPRGQPKIFVEIRRCFIRVRREEGFRYSLDFLVALSPDLYVSRR